MKRNRDNLGNHLSYLGINLLFACLPFALSAQNVVQDTAKNDRVLVDHADLFEYFQEKNMLRQYLKGNVELRQDSIYMYCDTALIENSINVFANGNVIIQQGDSLSVFSDSLVYDGSTRIAELFGEVVMVNGQQKLFTNRLSYDLNTKIATYYEGAILTDGEAQLSSKRGYFYVEKDEVYFKDSVVLIDPDFFLRADTLKFNTESKIAGFLGPTIISNDSSRIYCEAGFYDLENNTAQFEQNAQYVKGEQTAQAKIIRYDGQKEEYLLEGNARIEEGERLATADTIRYDEKNDISYLFGKARVRDAGQDIEADEIIYDAKNEQYATRGRSRISDPPQILEADQVDYDEEKGFGVALGNVVWQDTSAQLTILCEQANYKKKTDYLKAIGGKNGRPLLITIIDGDSLFMASDTLLSLRNDTLSTDSSRAFIAYRDVRIFKSNLQAVCDSLIYNTTDSIFRFFMEPIIWSDTSQFTADTVHIQLADNKIDQIFLYRNAFIINSPDEIYFNQVKGKDIVAFFEEGELRRMDVQGNAESVYYALDEEGAYVGVNKTICSEMLLYFGNNTVDQIKFFAEPKATLFPMKLADHQEMKIEGFHWEKSLRPKTVEDLFVAKKARPIKKIEAGSKRPKLRK